MKPVLKRKLVDGVCGEWGASIRRACRVHVLLRREGWPVGKTRTYRIYRELGLQLRNKTPKRRVKAKLRIDRKEATGPNETWAMDFAALPFGSCMTSWPWGARSGC